MTEPTSSYILQISTSQPRQYRVVVVSGSAGPAVMNAMLLLDNTLMRTIGAYDTVVEVMTALEAYLNMESK